MQQIFIGDQIYEAIDKGILSIDDIVFLYECDKKYLNTGVITDNDRQKRKEIKLKIKKFKRRNMYEFSY